MSESSQIHNNTFLSRVFAATSKTHPRNQQPQPLLNDDNSIYHHSYDKNDTHNVNDSSNFMRGDQRFANFGIGDSYSKTPTVNRPVRPHFQSKMAINVQSESESSFDDDDDDDDDDEDEDEEEEGDIDKGDDQNDNSYDGSDLDDNSSIIESVDKQKNSLISKNKRHLLRQLENELGVEENDDEDLVNFDSANKNDLPESLLLEDTRFSPTSKSRLRKRPKKSILKILEQSFVEQLKEVELGESINQLGEKAKFIANKTFNSIPKSFSLEHSILQPAPPNFLQNKQQSARQNGTSEIDFQDVFKARKLPAKERAMWMWANVSNLDIFLLDVYGYYLGNGWTCMALQRASDLLIIAFVIWLSLFMTNCIDYIALMNHPVSKFEQVYVSKCFSKTSFGQKSFLFLLFVIFVLRVKNTWNELTELREIKLFYNHLLNIEDEELQTISWVQIVKKIMILKDQHTNGILYTGQSDGKTTKFVHDMKSKTRLNAHDIANRLMRKDNYMIAIFNKNILKKPLTLSVFNTYFLTKTLEWNLRLCIFDFVFNEEGQLKPSVMSQHSRLAMSVELKKRFRLAGLMSIFLTPFLVVYFVLYFFLKFFYDFKTNPGLLNSREYSPYAKWKMREFNELPHLFEERLKLSVEGANEYLDQFPKEKVNILMKFITFISGSLLTILVILTIIDHENFLNFELTEGRTVLFYISTMGAIFTICKNNVSASNYVFNPEESLKYVSQFTHYLPTSWEGRYHTIDVKNQFCKLYNLKLALIAKELCSLLLLPWILYVSLPSSSENVIDFFRDFSVHVDGLGYVCTFAMFKLDQEGEKDKVLGASSSALRRYQPKSHNHRLNKKVDSLKYIDEERDLEANLSHDDDLDEDETNDEYYAANDDKMVKSYMYFLESYGGNGRNTTAQQLNKGSDKWAKTISNIERKKGLNDLSQKSNFRPRFNEKLEETSAGLLSNDIETYIDNLNKSVMLGAQTVQNSDNDPNKTNVVDNNDDVMGLLNQIYHQKRNN